MQTSTMNTVHCLPETAALPEWVPADFLDALDFYNAYGKCLIRGGLICIVQKIAKKSASSGSYYSTDCGSTAEFAILAEHLFCYERPAEDGANGENSFVRSLTASDYDPGFCFCMTLIRPLTPGRIERMRTVCTTENGRVRSIQERLCFSIDRDLRITKTGLSAWLPDTAEAFERFAERFGTVSLHGQYLVFCGGADAPVFTGNGAFELIREIPLNRLSLLPLRGTQSKVLRVYRPASAGSVQLSPASHLQKFAEKCFSISNALTVREISGRSLCTA